MTTTNIIELRAFLAAAIVGDHVARIRYYYTRTEQGQKTARILGRKHQAIDKRGKTYYRFGVGMKKVSEALGFTRAYLVKMKREAAKFGFLPTVNLLPTLATSKSTNVD